MFRYALSFFTIFLFLSLPFVILASTSGPDAELICLTSNRAECYPRLFEPTAEFQVVRDGQSLPPGLHVRMDFETGVKEAKLYDPTEDEDSDTQAIHVSSGESLQIVPGEDVMDEPLSVPSLPQAAKNPLKEAWKPLDNLYQKVFKSTAGSGGPKKPAINSDGDGTAFTTALELLLKEGKPDEYALDALEDLAHDIYWGQVLAERPLAIQRLTALMSDKQDPDTAGRAALVLGNAIHNNDAALRAVSSYSYVPAASSSSGASERTVFQQTVRLLRLDSATGSHKDDKGHELSPAAYARFIFLLSSLLQNPENHATFMEQGYWITLANEQHFHPRDAGHSPRLDRPRAKIADLVLDHLADASRFPSATSCQDPFASASSDAADSAASPYESNNELKPRAGEPSEAAVAVYEACKTKADASVALSLQYWQDRLDAALIGWELPDAVEVNSNILDHIREARDGVKSAKEQLNVASSSGVDQETVHSRCAGTGEALRDCLLKD